MPLLGVLPGTGGLTAPDRQAQGAPRSGRSLLHHAEGVRAARAKDWRLVDDAAPPQRFAELVRERARGARRDRAAGPMRQGDCACRRSRATSSGQGYRYRHVDGRLSTARRGSPRSRFARPTRRRREHRRDSGGRARRGGRSALARELDDAILMLRAQRAASSARSVLKTAATRRDRAGERRAAAEPERAIGSCARPSASLRRSLRVSTSPRGASIALIDRGSCFAGTLFELALAADRSYMLDRGSAQTTKSPRVTLGERQFRPAVRWSNGLLAARDPLLRRAAASVASAIAAQAGRRARRREAARGLGLVTVAPDELDWDDEIRLALEERASALARRAHRARGQPALRRAGDHGDAHLRPALGLAELDLQPAQRHRRERRA